MFDFAKKPSTLPNLTCVMKSGSNTQGCTTLVNYYPNYSSHFEILTFNSLN